MVTDEVPATTDTLSETVVPDHVAEAETSAAATAVEEPPESEASAAPAAEQTPEEPVAAAAEPVKPDNKHWARYSARHPGGDARRRANRFERWRIPCAFRFAFLNSDASSSGCRRGWSLRPYP